MTIAEDSIVHGLLACGTDKETGWSFWYERDLDHVDELVE